MKKIVIENKKAYKDFEIYETYEAGIVLKGSEVKSVRMGNVDLTGSYCKIKQGEIFVYNMKIAPYEKSFEKLPPDRERKLLLKKKEIKRLTGKVSERGFTIIPLKIYFNERGWAKLEIAVCKGRKKREKKQKLKEKEIMREIERAMKKWR